jgi:hypothetical protein
VHRHRSRTRRRRSLEGVMGVAGDRWRGSFKEDGPGGEAVARARAPLATGGAGRRSSWWLLLGWSRYRVRRRAALAFFLLGGRRCSSLSYLSLDSTGRPPADSQPSGPRADTCPFYYRVAKNNPLLLQCSKKWFTHEIKGKKTQLAGHTTGDSPETSLESS